MRRAVGVVLAAFQEGDPPGSDEATVQHVVEVGLDLWSARPLLKSRLRTRRLQPAVAQRGRCHAVEERCLVQPDERVGIDPVTSGRVTPIDQRHVHVRMVDQCIAERHPHRACTHHQVVGVQRSHYHSRSVLSPPLNMLGASR